MATAITLVLPQATVNVSSARLVLHSGVASRAAHSCLAPRPPGCSAQAPVWSRSVLSQCCEMSHMRKVHNVPWLHDGYTVPRQSITSCVCATIFCASGLNMIGRFHILDSSSGRGTVLFPLSEPASPDLVAPRRATTQAIDQRSKRYDYASNKCAMHHFTERAHTRQAFFGCVQQFSFWLGKGFKVADRL